MNKKQKLVQEAFLGNEELVIERLKMVYAKSLEDINGEVKKLQDDIDSVVVLKGLTTDPDELEILKSIERSKIYQKNYQEAMKKQIDGILDTMLDQEFVTVSDYLQTCYEDGFIGTMFDLHGQGIPLCFPLDQESIVRAVQLESKISNSLYSHLGENVQKLKNTIAAQVSRGISTGASYSQIALQIKSKMTGIYDKKSGGALFRAETIAVTEGHRIQVQSAMDACYKAQDSGADVVKQWDSTLDGATRPSHRKVDGEIRELDEPFSNGLMFPGDPDGGAAEVIRCRCALLQRARWALDEDELETLKERAKYFGLDKAKTFEDFKKKYIEAVTPTTAAKPKKEYLTKKKLEQNIAAGQKQMDELDKKFNIVSGGMSYDDIIKQHGSLDGYVKGQSLKKLEDIKDQMDDLQKNMDDWTEKLDKKLVAAETKKLKKEQTILKADLKDLQDELAQKQVKTYSGIWKDDVTTADYGAKMAGIQGKKDYFKNKIMMSSFPADEAKWQQLLDDVIEFEKEGSEYYAIQQKIKQAENKINQIDNNIKKIKKNGIMSAKVDDAFTQERKDAALWAKTTKEADDTLRGTCGDVWKNASKIEKDSIYDYTHSYSKFNEPLRGYEYGTNKYLGVGNVDLETIGVDYRGFKRGEVKQKIDAMTSIIEKSSYTEDVWVQRGCGYSGMDKFFGIDPDDFKLPEAELEAKLMASSPTEHGFFSTGVSKGKGFSHQPIIMNVYAPSGTKMMYAEPFSAFGNGSGRSWDGISPQSSFGSEAEMIFQRETTFRVTKVEKTGNKIYIDMEVIGQGSF